MADPLRPPSFATLLQRFFAGHLTQHRSVSPRTIAAYRDTFRLLLLFAERRIGKAPTAVVLTDLDAPLVLAFLDHLEAGLSVTPVPKVPFWKSHYFSGLRPNIGDNPLIS
jgi:hypothetical protein